MNRTEYWARELVAAHDNANASTEARDRARRAVFSPATHAALLEADRAYYAAHDALHAVQYAAERPDWRDRCFPWGQPLERSQSAWPRAPRRPT